MLATIRRAAEACQRAVTYCRREESSRVAKIYLALVNNESTVRTVGVTVIGRSALYCWRFFSYRPFQEVRMFDSLADRIREDDHQTTTERYLRYTVVAVIAVVLFGGLYFGIKFLEF